MITKMTKYSFILLSDEAGKFLEKLQEMGVVDITRSGKPVDVRSSAMLEKAMETKKAAALLGRTDYGKDPDCEAILKASEEAWTPQDIIRETYGTIAEIERLKAGIDAMTKEMEARMPWGDFDRHEIDRLEKEGCTLRWYTMPKKRFDESWLEQYPLQIISENNSSIWFVTASVNGDDYDFPAEETAAPAGNWKESQAEKEKLKTALISMKGRMLILKKHVPELQEAYREQLSELDLYLADASKEMAAENMLTVFTGFAPADMEEKLCAEFDKMDVAYIKSEAAEEDNPPIKLKNNWFVRQFEVLTGMYGMPVYSEFDPTPILGPFFLLFFAMCMGDAGYGILLIIIGQLLKKTKGSMASLSSIVTTLGIGSIFVGIILGTFFGINLVEASWVPAWLKKCMITGEIAGYSAQMVLAIGIGIFHICLAMTIKAICYTKRFGFKENISTWAWLILIVGVLATAGMALLGVMSEPVVKWTVIVLGIISGLGIFIFNVPGRNPLINIGAGLWDTYNMATGLLGDTLSYIRLYALGLSGGMLGNAFNNLAAMFQDGIHIPGLNWLGFIVILLLGHCLNLAMSCLGAFVHPLRLTFVEYFKNSGYEGKGAAYKPLAKEGQAIR